MRFILLGIIFLISLNKVFAQLDSLLHNGYNRVYLLYVPSTYDAAIPYSLIIILHGASGTETSLYNSGFNERAGLLKYIAVYPRGINRNWNGPDNDVDFISDLIDTLCAEFNIDTSRIYAAGQSAGAFFSYRLACSLPYKISAIAPLAGAAGCITTVPVPVCAIHALNDQTVSYTYHKSSLSAWREVNQCNSSPDTIYNLNGVTGELWSAESTGADVAFYSYLQGGHSWLNSPVSCVDFITDFFYDHPKRNIKVTLTSPLNTIFEAPCSIDLSAEVEGDSGVIKIEYYADSSMIGSSAAPPYSLTWNNAEPDEYLIYAKAIFSSGTTEISSNIKQIQIIPPNAALLKPAESSANESSLYTAENAFDGNFFTRWSTPFSDPHWISVDLQGNYLISGVTLFWETACGSEYTVDVSGDGENWQTVYSTASGRGGTEHISFEPVQAGFVRMYGTRRATAYGYSLWEFQVHGTEVNSVLNSKRPPFKLTVNASPNPFNSETIIHYTIAEDGIAEINIFNMNGEKIRTLLLPGAKAGKNITRWNGCDDSGNAVTSGVYICRVNSKDRSAAVKLILMK